MQKQKGLLQKKVYLNLNWDYPAVVGECNSLQGSQFIVSIKQLIHLHASPKETPKHLHSWSVQFVQVLGRKLRSSGGEARWEGRLPSNAPEILVPSGISVAKMLFLKAEKVTEKRGSTVPPWSDWG